MPLFPVCFSRKCKKRKMEMKEKLVEIRQVNKTTRSTTRQGTKAVAYQNGIDPNKAMWEGFSSIAQSAAGAIVGGIGAKQIGRASTSKGGYDSSGAAGGFNRSSAFAGFTRKRAISKTSNNDNQPNEEKGLSTPLMIGIGVLILFGKKILKWIG